MPSSPTPRVRINPETFAITAVTYQRYRLFQRTSNAELLLATLFRYREQGRFQLHGFVVMPDHIHVLITPAHDHTIERCIQFIKGGFSFAIRKDFPGEVWQNDYHAHRVTSPEDYRAQLLYIANNPTRKNLLDYPHIHTKYPTQLDAHLIQKNLVL
ncbi:MAG: transposase IS200-family protein [Acidobacteriaceae bacterium]|nr:transposase IS200-family protein [Acidobacteriaceae bacterium]